MDITSTSENDPLRVYLRELSTIQLLTEDEETDLLQRVESQDAEAESASRHLIESKLSLVVSIAERYSSAGINMLNLIQEGNLGLFFALKTFPENPNDTFATHAFKCIEGAISKAVAESQSAK